MTDLSDMLLRRPVDDLWARWQLFFLFYLHLFFILILIGTAIIGVHHFIHSFWTKENFEFRWDKKVLKKFIIPKALGVALGTILIVVIQTYYAVPFYTAVTIFAPFWLALIVVMIFGFFFVDGISHKLEVHPYISLVLGSIGLILVVAIPAVFVAVLVATENSDQWIAIAQHGFRFPVHLTIHWLFRYLHVIAAGIVFGAAFQYLVTVEGHEYRQRALVQWMLLGLLAQFVLGGILALTLQESIGLWVLLPLFIGIVCAVVLVGLLYFRGSHGQVTSLGWAGVILLPVLLGGMLVTRQMIQQEKVLPLIAKADRNAEQWRQRLEPFRLQQLISYQHRLQTVRTTGETIYLQSCSFCHGRTGLGDGEERGHLVIPPERLVYLRAEPAYIQNVLQNGIPGTAMPYFTIYERPRLMLLMDYLGNEMGLYDQPEPVPVPVAPQASTQAQAYFNGTCSMCHGLDGSGQGDYAPGLRPAPPDFRHYAVSPRRAFEVIRDGYPGTAMPSFAQLPEDLRWGLVQYELSFRVPQAAGNVHPVAFTAK